MRYLDAYQAGPDAIRDLLDRPSLALLAVADAPGPEVGVFPFLYRGGRVEMHLERSDLQVAAIERAGCGTVVISESLATVPSYWVGPDNLLFADAFHRTVVMRGTTEVIREPTAIWEHLQALLLKYQKEGPKLDPGLQHYRHAAERLTVVRVSADEVRAKFKLGQQQPEAVRRRVIEGLRRRGSELDRRTADLVAATLQRSTDGSET